MSQALRTLRRLAAKPLPKVRPVVVPASSPEPSPLAPEPWRHALETWDAEARFVWEERGAIMQFDGGLSLEAAEKAAFEDVSRDRDATR